MCVETVSEPVGNFWVGERIFREFLGRRIVVPTFVRYFIEVRMVCKFNQILFACPFLPLGFLSCNIADRCNAYCGPTKINQWTLHISTIHHPIVPCIIIYYLSTSNTNIISLCLTSSSFLCLLACTWLTLWNGRSMLQKKMFRVWIWYHYTHTCTYVSTCCLSLHPRSLQARIIEDVREIMCEWLWQL